MKKFYSFALFILSLFSCFIFSACGDKFKNLDVRLYSNDGVLLNEVNFMIEQGKSSSKRIGVELLGIDEAEVGQIVVYSIPNELLTVNKYTYNGKMCYVDITPNMSSGENAKLVISHLASGKKKEVPLKIDQKATDLNVINSSYIISIPKTETKEHLVDMLKVVDLQPSGSTNKVFFKCSTGLPVGVEIIDIEDNEDLENVFKGFKVSSSVEDKSFVEIYPVTYLNGEFKEYENKKIKVWFRITLDDENLTLHSDFEIDLTKDIELVENDNNVNFFKLSLMLNGTNHLKDLDYFDFYDVVVNSSDDLKVSAFFDGNKDILLNANMSTEKAVDVTISLIPKNVVGDIQRIDKVVKVKGVSKADTIEVTKNGKTISLGETIDIFDYYSEGNSLGALFMFKPQRVSGSVVDAKLKTMRLLVKPEILCKNNNKGAEPNNLASKLYLLEIHNFYEFLKFSYDSNLDCMVSEPISENSRIYIKYINGDKGEEPTNFGFKVETINTSNYEHWEKVKSTDVSLNFNRLEGVKSMIVNAGFYMPEKTGKYEYIDEDNPSFIYLDRLKGLDNVELDNPGKGVYRNFLNIKNGSVIGVDNGEISSVKFEVDVQPLNSATKPLTIYNGLVSKDGVGFNEISYVYEKAQDDDIISLVLRSDTSIGDYKITFKQEGVEKASVICRVYESLNGLTKEMISFETNKNAFKNINYTKDYSADYIVASGQDLNIALDLNNSVLSSQIVAGYAFSYEIVAEDGSVVEEGENFKKQDYFDFKHDYETYNNALLKFIKGTYLKESALENKNHYVQLKIVVKTKIYSDLVTEVKDRFDESNEISIKFFVYETIKEEDLSISNANMTRYVSNYLSVYHKELSNAELSINMKEDLWHYVTGENKITWSIDNGTGVTRQVVEGKYVLTFNEVRGSESYVRTVKAHISQFDTLFEFQCVFYVEKPIVTERLLIDSAVRFDSINQSYYINLKKGETYEMIARNISSLGQVSNPEIIIQVAEQYGSAYSASNYFEINQTNSTIKVKEVDNKYNFKLIVFAKDALKEIVSSDKSGYNNPSLFIMNDFQGADLDRYLNAYFVIDIILSDGTKDSRYLIHSADDFWKIDDTEEFKSAHYKLMSSISLNNTTDNNEKTIRNFLGSIITDGPTYVVDGITLNNTNVNLFKGFEGEIENIRFIVNFNYLQTNNINGEINLGLFDINNGKLTDVAVQVSGKAELNGSATYNFGALAGINNTENAEITYVNNFGVKGNIELSGNAKVYFGGLVGKNVSSIVGCEVAKDVGGDNEIVLNVDNNRNNAMSQIEITSTLANNSAIGGVVGLNSFGTIKNAFVQAVIYAPETSNVGGVVGENEQDAVQIQVNLNDKYITVANDVLASFLLETSIEKAIYNVKSASIITAKENVGGIVGLDKNGLFVDCDFQILSTDNAQTSIFGTNNVGGIAGNSVYGKFAYCSVMNYALNYNLWNTTDASSITGLVADICADHAVGGIVGLATSDSKTAVYGNNLFTNKVFVLSSSVNAVLKTTSEQVNTFGNIGGILSSNEGVSVLFNVYFMGKLEGDVNYKTLSTQAGSVVTTHYFALDSDGSSLFNAGYCLNVDNSTLKVGQYKDDMLFVIDRSPNLHYWSWNENINGGKIFITTNTTDVNKLPIFDLAPDEIDVKVKDEDNEKLQRVLQLKYYDFSIATNADNATLLELDEKYNKSNYVYKLVYNEETGKYENVGELDIVAKPNGLGAVVVNVYSTNTTIVDITFDGRILVYGVGECELVFSSVLNPHAGVIKNRTIKVVVDYPLGEEFNVGTSQTDRSKIVSSSVPQSIQKDSSRQYYALTSGNVVENLKTYAYKTKSNLGLKVEVKYATTDNNFKVEDYILISGIKGETTYEDENSDGTIENAVLTVYLNNKTPFILSVVKKLEVGSFEVIVTPFVEILGEADEFDKNINFELLTSEGISSVAFSYDDAVVYPNDIVYVNAYLLTDKKLTTKDEIYAYLNYVGNNRYSYTSNIDNLINREYNILRNGIKIGSFIIEVVDFETYENNIQTIRFKLEFSEMNFGEFEAEEIPLDVQFKLSNKNKQSVFYSILPQRINKIEIKNYYYKVKDVGGVSTTERVLEDILKPNHVGEMIIDIVPNNGYYSYLEISDVTGSEEILFMQVDKDGNALSLDYDPASDGKGIKLYDYNLGTSRIYIRTQIDNRYSSRMHTIEVRAYSSNGTMLSKAQKQIDVRMLPEITATYVLPDGRDGVVCETAETKTVMLANGVDANLRIKTINSNSDLQYEISSSDGNALASKYELINTSGDMWLLHRKDSTVINEDVGKTLTVKFTTYALMDNGDFDMAECTFEFKIESFVVHSVSVNNSIDNLSKQEIYGYFERDIKLNFYFDEDDISYYHPQDNKDNFWNTEYVYDSSILDTDTSVEGQINNILRKLNSYDDDGNSEYLKFNDNNKNVNGDYTYSQTPTKLQLNENKLLVKEGYSPEYLAVLFDLVKVGEIWKIKESSDEFTSNYKIDKNYHLNFINVMAWDDPEIVETQEEFEQMVSGGSYILKEDITLTNYVPIDVNLESFDGNGNTITINSFGLFNETKLHAGLFKQVYDGMIVKNVKVKYQSENGETGNWSFGFVGDNEGITYADLCNNKDVAYTEAKFGGITAVNNGIITNCYVTGLVALSASTLEQKSVSSGGNYEIAFNIAGLVAENSETGYITNSTTDLSIYALANVGGFVHTNAGKIVSCGVEKQTTIYGYNVTLGNTIVIEVSGFAVENLGHISMSYVNLETEDVEVDYLGINNIERIETIECGKMSAKDISAGFVYSNSGSISDAYVQMEATGINNNSFAGFVYSNSGAVEKAYTYINGGIRLDSNDTMFAPAGTSGLTNCIEFVMVKAGYSSGIAELKTVPTSERYLKTVYENVGFAFGDNESAVWSLKAGNLPKLTSTQEFSFDLFEPATFKVESSEIIDGVEKVEYKPYYANYGTKTNPFIVHNLQTWNYYFNEENNKNNMTGYYRIVKDINFGSIGDNPTTSTTTFSGNIQGNNMNLKGVMLYSSSNLSSLGLFGKLQGVGDATLKNSVRNLNLSATSVWASSTEAVGVLAGIIENFNIYNITIDAENVIMVGRNAVGGLAGVVRGEFDIDQISSNIGVNATRASTLSSYSVYMSKNNNKDVSQNLGSVYYAGSIVGVLDAYNRNTLKLNEPRNINKGYYYARNIKVLGNVVVTADTAGVAFGFVGEKVFVKNAEINISGSVFGSQYSSGFIGENRGVIDGVRIVMADNVFEKSKHVSSGAVGFNLGGLVQNVYVEANINKTEHAQIVAGTVGRNVFGTISNCEYNGELFGYFTGGIVGADYNEVILLTASVGSGALSGECKLNKNLIPFQSVQYVKDGTEIKHLRNVSISRGAFNYMVENSKKYYSYRKVDGGAGSLEAIMVKGRVLGLVAGLSCKDVILKDGNEMMINIGENTVTFNGGKETMEPKTETITLQPDLGVEFAFENINTFNAGLGANRLMFVVGSKVTSFDSWSSYSDEYFLVQ